MKHRIAFVSLVLIGLAVGGLVACKGRSAGPPAAAAKPVTQTENPMPAKLGGPFTLVDQQGHPITDRDLLGKPTAIFFGFTYCPEVCPTTLTALTGWMRALGTDADKLNVVFVTIDPERDTSKQLTLYLSSFDPRIRGLTGTPAQIAQVASEYGVYYQKVPMEGGGYTMDHSSAVYLMNAHGGFVGVIGYQEPNAQALEQLRALTHS